MDKKAQIFRIIILAILLGVSLFLLLSNSDLKSDDQIKTTAPSQIITTKTTAVPTTTQETTTEAVTTTTTTKATTATTTTSTTASAPTTTETSIKTDATQETTAETDAATTTTSAQRTTTTSAQRTTTTTTTTAQATTTTTTTAAPTTTESSVFYGPYVLNDISPYNIIDPNRDYTGAGTGDNNFDLSSISRGIIKVFYFGEGDYKVRIEKGNEAYNYDLKANGTIEVFPLQMGNGSYRAMILKRIADTRFSVVKSVSFNADISDQNRVYINSIQIIYWLPQMTPISYSRNTLISDILTNGKVPKQELSMESFRAVWSYILSNISYDKDKYNNISNLAGYVPSISATFAEKKGICYDYAAFMAGVLRSFGIPVKLVTGYCPTYYGDVYHAWNEVYINGRWIVVDPTYDASYFQAGHRVDFEKDRSLYTISKKY